MISTIAIKDVLLIILRTSQNKFLVVSLEKLPDAERIINTNSIHFLQKIEEKGLFSNSLYEAKFTQIPKANKCS